jgi:hypothetical protein
MIQIDELTVNVQVEGDSDADECAFAQLFNKYIRLWAEELKARQAQDARSARDRSLGAG